MARGARRGATTPRQILATYVVLTLLSTFAASFIWGINTLFLLDAGLGVTAAFAANAFFTAGQVLFEVPTGVVADTWGRRRSFLLGAATLLVSTLLYLWLWRIEGPLAAWAAVSMLLGLGFTFFSGATEAWLVDGLEATGYEGSLESAFGKGQVATGVAMLGGTLAGGALAEATSLGAPYVVRAVLLVLTFAVAFARMHDIGFKPRRSGPLGAELRRVLAASLDHGLRSPRARWLMLGAPFAGGVSIYAFYAMQPYLLELYGGGRSYTVVGLAAAVVAGAQIAGGLLVPHAGKVFRRRTSALAAATLVSAAALAAIGLVDGVVAALALLSVWALVFASVVPLRQAYLNALIPSAHRATVLSSDNLLTSAGGVVFQPALGRIADIWSYATSYLVAAGIELLALPFVLLARRQGAAADRIEEE